MAITIVKVSEKGQIAIPQIVRQELGIEKGDDLILLQVRGKLLIEKTQKTEDRLTDDFKNILNFSEKSLQEVWNNKEDEIWSKYLK